MLNQSVKGIDKSIEDLTAKGATVAQKLSSGISDAAESAKEAMKTEVDHLSRATREVASLVGAEVVKRPLTYTLAAAGAGALVGIGIMSVLNRPKHVTH